MTLEKHFKTAWITLNHLIIFLHNYLSKALKKTFTNNYDCRTDFLQMVLFCRASLLFWRICLIEMCCKHMHVDVLWAQHGSLLLSQIHWLLLLAASETHRLSAADNVHRFPGLSAVWWWKMPQHLCIPLQQKTLPVRTFTFHVQCSILWS